MAVITQFRSSAIHPAELNHILAEYLAVERLRVFRRLLIRRFGLLAATALVAGVVLRWISLPATVCSVAAFLVPPIWVWVAEIRRDSALARELERIPGVIQTHTAQVMLTSRQSTPLQKVIKSS